MLKLSSSTSVLLNFAFVECHIEVLSERNSFRDFVIGVEPCITPAIPGSTHNSILIKVPKRRIHPRSFVATHQLNFVLLYRRCPEHLILPVRFRLPERLTRCRIDRLI